MPAHHILVPIDLSPSTDLTFDYALRLARSLQARVTLLHVIEPLLLGHRDPLAYPAMQALESRITEQLSAYRMRLVEAGLQGDFAVLHGVPYQVIVETAGRAGADLIVMGTHGRSGLAYVLLGSVAERVVQLAPCSVLVARTPRDEPGAPATQ
ncbi:MAG: universal stress protein [Candidatus Tectimicrobiota bacterium]